MNENTTIIISYRSPPPPPPPLPYTYSSPASEKNEMAGGQNREPVPHAIMIPYPYQGHINPFVHLAIKLASRGFVITFVNTHSIHHQISKARSCSNGDDIFAEARKSGLDIRYATVNDGFPLSFDRSLKEDQFVEGLLHVFSAHVEEVVGDLVKSDPPATCLIADTFFVWGSSIAKKFNLVHVSFWTEPALVLTLYYHLDLLKKHGHFASNGCNRRDTVDYIPGVKGIEPRDLMSYLQAEDIWTVVHRVIYKAFEDVKRADIIICNTIEELEAETLSALDQKQPTYAIGPVFVAGFTSSSVTTSLWSESDCSQWLNGKQKDSVLYVSFGSYAHSSKEDIVEIAHGLAHSGVSFIWVLRPDIVSSNESDFLPVGFEEKIKNRGLIVPWCSQIEVISHPAVGGFLTHCGWNSILESIWCSLPLICCPLVTDQFTNRKLVVNDWEIGINLCDEDKISREEVADKIKRLMSGETLMHLREAIKKVRRTSENAVLKDGSSERNFNQFIEEMKIQMHKKVGMSNGHSHPSKKV